MTFENESYCSLCGSYFQSNTIEQYCQACREMLTWPKEKLIKELVRVKWELSYAKLGISLNNRKPDIDGGLIV